MYGCLMAKYFKQQFSYRAEVFLQIVGNIFKLYMQVCIWQALLGHGGISSPVTLPEMVTYVVVSFVLSGLLRSKVAYTLEEKVEKGAIAIDLIRPVNLGGYLFFEQLSANAFYVVFSCLPVLVVALFAWGIHLPSLVYLLAFGLSVCGAVVLMYLIEYSMGLLVFWVKSGVYPDFIVRGLFVVFSGTMIPLWFYPDYLVKISNLLPFRLISFEPIAIYLGKYSISRAFEVVLFQMVWIVGFWLLQGLIWRKVQHSIVVQGG